MDNKGIELTLPNEERHFLKPNSSNNNNSNYQHNNDDNNNHHKSDLSQIQHQCNALEPPKHMHKNRNEGDNNWERSFKTAFDLD